VKLVLPAAMLLALGLALLSGLPVAVVLIGVALLFASIALIAGAMRSDVMCSIFNCIY
jgi:TRAP-type mannitol/chloroaromatic compound transport system permease large subunit